MKKIFHPIVRAVILKDEKVLVAHSKGADNTFLPGGHIETGENTTNALKRELYEEMKLNVEVDKYLGAIESEWVSKNYNHEINQVFLCKSNDHEKLETMESLEDHLEFFWKRPDELNECNLQPAILQTFIGELVNGRTEILWHSSIKTPLMSF